jgi:hypothetical protein
MLFSSSIGSNLPHAFYHRLQVYVKLFLQA